MENLIRRMDDLGRVAIPKEVRKAMKLKYGDAFEVTYKDNTVIFKKISESEEYKYEIKR